MVNEKPIVFFASDTNPMYKDFEPYVTKAWESFGFEVNYTLIDSNNYFVDPSIIPFGNQSQICRVLLPALYPNRICITSDIDMIPLSKQYFKNGINLLNNQESKEILSLSADAYNNNSTNFYKRHPICYLAGYGSTFSIVTKVKSYEDISQVMKEWWMKKHGWDTDEICFSTNLYSCIALDKISLIEQNRGWGNGIAKLRIDRANWNYNIQDLNNNKYIDSHMLRPLSSFKETLDPLFNSISIL